MVFAPLKIVLSVLFKYRQFILLLIAVFALAGILYKVQSDLLESKYNEGRAVADKLWKDSYERDVASRNKRIRELEKSTTEAAQLLREEVKKSEVAVNAAYEKWKSSSGRVQIRVVQAPSIPVEVTAGEDPVCRAQDPAPVPDTVSFDVRDILLPSDYVETWNELGRQAFKGLK